MSISKNCEGTTRRDCLQLGLGALLAGGFVNALRLRGEAAGKKPDLEAEARSCILVWLDGGPSHYETFDPKPHAPAEIQGQFGTIPTKDPSVRYSDHVPHLAGISDKLSMVRSICHNQGNHGAGNHYMMTGAPPRIPVGCGAFVSFHPSLGSATAYCRPSENGLPSYFSIPSMSRSGGPNFLGAQYAPFVVPDDPNGASFRVRDVALPTGLTEDRFLARRDVRGLVDRMVRINEKAAADPVLALDDYYRQGYDLITSTSAQAAFDIQNEDEKVRESYGRNPFGQRCLLARRLVEAGVPFITLYNGGWDHHVDIFKTCDKMLPPLDQGVAALVRDLEERGLLDSTLIVVLGEFGRTPKINANTGRDHWSNAMSVLMAGAGCPGGLTLGATDKNGYSAVDRVLSPENFASTIYKKLGIDPGQVLYTPQGRPTHLVSDPTPIEELFA